MGGERKNSLLTLAGRVLNCAVSFVVFSVLDVLDIILCIVYKLIDYAVEAEWKPCYCSASKDMVAGSGSGSGGGPKVVRLCSSKLQLEDVSDTLYARPSVVMDAARKAGTTGSGASVVVSPAPAAPTFRVSTGVAEMIRGKIDRQRPTRPVPCWSDCCCKICNSWSTAATPSQLYVHVEGPRDGAAVPATEDVVFIHGFISSSTFWTETVFPAFSELTKSRYRLFAIDLLGFGRSPKPTDSLYTLREHLEMIEKSVLKRFEIGRFHLVAHSLGSILALALAVKHPEAVRSLTLVAPPYFPVPKGEERAAGQYVMRQVAPRRVWPAIAFGASMACWYEHVSRTICLTICKHHRLWDLLFRLLTRNRLGYFERRMFCTQLSIIKSFASSLFMDSG
ncbi:probable lysophospholipase BODYGUARD 3 isoform X2 [Ananas comosus]|uniref:Probable lysophospholipase BODYGUARD 3 isoform X2 n=1 Tax=Ananas comosus TaxID=4615 RepID=A0A6P5H2S2_ANACO|nr:probable lysophospholipase BODYGUARD 3 isoform X2 [Ananas comosus]